MLNNIVIKNMTQASFYRIILFVLLATVILIFSSGSVLASSTSSHWSYAGKDDPKSWGLLASERLRWFVMRNPVEVSSSQIAKFLSVINENARPVQQINARFLLKNQ